MRDTARPVPGSSASRTVFDLALDQMLWSRKSLLVILLLALSALFGVAYRLVLAVRISPHLTPLDLYGWIVAIYYVGNVLPLAVLFYATSMVSEEVEAKTIIYLLSRPVGRSAILI